MGNNDAQTIGELVATVKLMREEQAQIKTRLEKMVTTDDLKDLEQRLKKEIDDNAPSALFWTLTKAAAGVVSIAAAIGVFLALVKVFAK